MPPPPHFLHHSHKYDTLEIYNQYLYPMAAVKAKKTTKRPLKTEELKEKILEQEEKVQYSSSRFGKIEDQVKASLQKQATDEALKDVSIGALVVGSSDVHYECFEGYVVVRFRIDGVLVDIFRLTHKEYKKIVERLKYAANLKLNITNIPQDGKYSIEVQDTQKIDVRVSTLPIKYGENIVCRILDSSNAIIDFEQL